MGDGLVIDNAMGEGVVVGCGVAVGCGVSVGGSGEGVLVAGGVTCNKSLSPG